MRQETGRYVTCRQASELLDNLLSQHTLSLWARQGKIPGAVRAGGRIWLLRKTLHELVVDLSCEPAARKSVDEREPAFVFHDRRAHTTMDGYLAS